MSTNDEHDPIKARFHELDQIAEQGISLLEAALSVLREDPNTISPDHPRHAELSGLLNQVQGLHLAGFTKGAC